jgi:predicted RNA-binding Zn-ribbon protein involved in translation (DUF1610 family)
VVILGCLCCGWSDERRYLRRRMRCPKCGRVTIVNATEERRKLAEWIAACKSEDTEAKV